MRKVKIVQISACFDNEGNSGNEYLDDKGRVWYQSGRWSDNDPATRHWIVEWQLLELPEEPEL